MFFAGHPIFGRFAPWKMRGQSTTRRDFMIYKIASHVFSGDAILFPKIQEVYLI